MDNLHNKQFTTNPDKNDKSLNATALAVLLLKDAPRYWHGHPGMSQYRCMRQQITSFDVLKISGGEAWLTRTAISRSPLWMLCR